MLGQGYRTFHPGAGFLSTKILITSGQSDTIATPAQTARVRTSIERNGFRQVRLEMFPEGHRVKRPLTVEALRWFQSDASPSPVGASDRCKFCSRAGCERNWRRRSKTNSCHHQRRCAASECDHRSGLFHRESTQGRPRFIYAHSDLSMNLRGAAEASAKVDVPELKSDPSRRAPKGFVLTGVGDVDGWIVTSQANNTTFQVRASNPALLDVAQGKSHDSLDSMIADYEKRTASSARRCETAPFETHPADRSGYTNSSTARY